MPEATQHTNQQNPSTGNPAATPTPAPLRSVVVLDAPTGGWGIEVSCESPSPKPRRRRNTSEAASGPHHPKNAEGGEDDEKERMNVDENMEVNAEAINNEGKSNEQHAPHLEVKNDAPHHHHRSSRPRAATATKSDEPARFRMRREEAFPGWGEPAPSYRYFGEEVQRRFRAMKAAACEPSTMDNLGSGGIGNAEGVCEDDRSDA